MNLSMPIPQVTMSADLFYFITVMGGAAIFLCAFWIVGIWVRCGINGFKVVSRALEYRRPFWWLFRQVTIGKWEPRMKPLERRPPYIQGL